MREFPINTPHEGFINITRQVTAVVTESKIGRGVCHVFIPHTTAGITINENADPDVVTDMLKALNAMVPNLSYLHREGNSRAHVKATLVGSSVFVPVEGGKLCLGIWQGIYFCEFDGPRQRKVFVQVVGE